MMYPFLVLIQKPSLAESWDRFLDVILKPHLIRHYFDLIACTDKLGIQSLILTEPFHVIQNLLAARVRLRQWCRLAGLRDP